MMFHFIVVIIIRHLIAFGKIKVSLIGFYSAVMVRGFTPPSISFSLSFRPHRNHGHFTHRPVTVIDDLRAQLQRYNLKFERFQTTLTKSDQTRNPKVKLLTL